MANFISYQRHPRGYRSPLGAGVPIAQPTPALDVGELVSKCHSKIGYFGTLSEHMEVIASVKKHLGRLHEWLKAQDNNESITQNAYDFLIDTIEFINTGRRPYSIATRSLLIEKEANEPNPVPARQRVPSLAALLTLKSDNDCILAWLRQCNGTIDILCTLDVIFGNNTPSMYY